MKRKSLLAIVLCVVMIFSTAAIYAADLDTRVDGIDDSRAITSGSVGMVRSSALRGKMTLTCSSSVTDLTYIKATVTVEKKYSSGWSQYADPFELYGNAEFGNLTIVDYVDVKESGTYRIKVVFEEKKGSVTMTTSGKYSQAVSL